MSARWLPSPNFAPGRSEPVRFVVIHGTFSVTEARSLDYLLRSKAPNRVSSHYLITYTGEVLQLVREEDTAWHAGRSAWGAHSALNASSVGIEISNVGPLEPYAEVQLGALEGLLSGLLARWGLPPRAVLGHSDIAPDRKDDPGAHFPWARLEAAGLAAPWVPAPAGTAPLEALRAWGWRGAERDTVLGFQRRYLPKNLSGRLDAATLRRIAGQPLP